MFFVVTEFISLVQIAVACISVGPSVCPVDCGKTADRIRMPFDIVGRTSPGMSQVVGFGDQSTGRGTFGGEFGSRHCNQCAVASLGFDARGARTEAARLRRQKRPLDIELRGLPPPRPTSGKG